MKCQSCQKEIGDDKGYCPYCGKRLRPAEQRRGLWTRVRQGSIVNRACLNIILWVFICGSLSGIFFAIDYASYAYGERSDPYERITRIITEKDVWGI